MQGRVRPAYARGAGHTADSLASFARFGVSQPAYALTVQVCIDFEEDEPSSNKACIVTFTSYYAAKQAIFGENGRTVNNLVQGARFWMDGSAVSMQGACSRRQH